MSIADTLCAAFTAHRANSLAAARTGYDAVLAACRTIQTHFIYAG
jgi:hypothetical protein